MILRPLGQTGIVVSLLGLGTVKFGRNQKVKYPEPFELPSDSEIESLLDLALELGINLLDTAPAYGTSEERLGKLLGHRRGQFVITTKTGEEFGSDGVSRYDFSAEHTRQSIERSLRRLRADRLDGVLVHCNSEDLQALVHSPVLETLQGFKDRGLIRSFGASTNSVPGGLKAVELSDMVMATFNATQTQDKPVIERAAELRKGVLIKKGLQSGHGGGTLRKAMPVI